MAKKYDNEFKTMIVELLLSGVSAKQIHQDYGLNISMIGRWRREYKAKNGDLSKPKELTPQEIELKKIKKELQDVKLERDILKKAVSIFSKSDR